MTRPQFPRLSIRAISIVISILLIAALSTAQTNEAQRIDRKNQLANTALAHVPEKARATTNPFAGDPEAQAAGGKLYQQHCANCHGEKAGGVRPGTSLLRESMQKAKPGALFWILTNGVVRHGMPVWSKLPEPERWQIVTFLESLQPHSVAIRETRDH